MASAGRRFEKCADIALEAERLLAEGYPDAAQVLHNRVAETCVFGEQPCPLNSECRVAVARVARKLTNRRGGM